MNRAVDNLQAPNSNRSQSRSRIVGWLLLRFCNLIHPTWNICPFFPPTLLSLGFYKIWFKLVLLGIHLWEKRLQESSLAQLMLYPWMNYKTKSWLLRATPKERGLCGDGPPCRAMQAFYLSKRDFVLKTFPFVCSCEKRSLLKAACIWWLHFKMNPCLFPKGQGWLLHLKVIQNQLEMERKTGTIIRKAIP